ncbi:MAG: chemotaxis protein CheW [Armatimonadota bacterium]
MAKKEETNASTVKTQLVVFKLRDEEFGVDISQVREIVRMMHITHIPEAPGFIEGVINLRGQVIAVIDLSKQFEMAEIDELPKTARIVVVEVHGETVGLIVDEVPEVITIPEDCIEGAPELIETEVKDHYIRGVAKIEERLLILVDLGEILKPQKMEEIGRAVKE